MVWIKNTDGEKFEFVNGMIEQVSSDIATDLDTNVMPASGPMSNQGYDFNGVEKTISIGGVLFDSTSSVVSGGSYSNNIRDKKIMKYWLEALQNGSQSVVEFYSDFEEKSITSGAITTTMTDDVSSSSVTLNAAFETTKVFVRKVTFDNEAGNPEVIPFTIELWVGGY